MGNTTRLDSESSLAPPEVMAVLLDGFRLPCEASKCKNASLCPIAARRAKTVIFILGVGSKSFRSNNPFVERSPKMCGSSINYD